MESKKQPKRSYRKYSSEFKLEAVRQLHSGVKASDLSVSLGVSESLLYRWKSELSSSGKQRGDQAELKALRKRVKALETDNEILKKALRIFSQAEP